ncbi:salicylate hydroxylase [Talaromyces islandicus]|uniref:Salicylate hydroxylase n=1 Tax=Talaromyces islandicus TaxID=28573 RepID=A0A0U1LUG9_TALIS|nr:salicylate hydroxylase [Talaromyces islandicus]
MSHTQSLNNYLDAKPTLAEPSYPSNCLEFARHLAESLSSNGHAKNGKTSLKIILVGGGLGGLATAIALKQSGHHVTVYEKAGELSEIGAGIQVPSNSTRILIKLGLEKYLKPFVTEPEAIVIRRWQNGKVIGNTRLIPDFVDSFKAPYYVVHRADFLSALHKKALDEKIEINLGHKVSGYDPMKGDIILEDGTTHSGDLIVAADGIHSIARKCILGEDMVFQESGLAAYRNTVDVKRMRDDPEVSWVLERPSMNVWVGDAGHAMTYTIGSGKTFNFVLAHPDTTDPSTWDQRDNIGDMKSRFAGWDPVVTKIIGMVDSTLKWPLLNGSPLSRWASGKLVILGDAAHPMLPYMSQGAAMAVEDAAALTRALSKMESPAQLEEALGIFEKVRIKRTGQMHQASLLNSQLWHLADGPWQEARDAAMEPEVKGFPFAHSPNQWSDPATQMWCYGYDCEKEIDKEWENSLNK